MLILKFTKTQTAALVSHVDNLRAITYLIRRAGVDVQYSRGFNPHMELGFSPPIPLGVESLAEYVSLQTDESDILDKLNAVCPEGITFLRQWNASVNLAAKLNRAQYRIEATGIGDVIDDITADGYCITYDDRGQFVTKDVSARIFAAAQETADSALVTLAIGNDNLRPDRLILHLMKKHNLQGDYHITKIAAYVDEVSADEFLDGIAMSNISQKG